MCLIVTVLSAMMMVVMVMVMAVRGYMMTSLAVVAVGVAHPQVCARRLARRIGAIVALVQLADRLCSMQVAVVPRVVVVLTMVMAAAQTELVRVGHALLVALARREGRGVAAVGGGWLVVNVAKNIDARVFAIMYERILENIVH